MNSSQQRLPMWLRTPVVTRNRVMFAMTVAVVADATQALFSMFGPPGWLVDEVVDVIAMGLTCAALGFHPMLLPSFLVKMVPFPIPEMLPTWTACTATVAILRRRDQAPGQAQPAQPPVILPPKSLPASGGGGTGSEE